MSARPAVRASTRPIVIATAIWTFFRRRANLASTLSRLCWSSHRGGSIDSPALCDKAWRTNSETNESVSASSNEDPSVSAIGRVSASAQKLGAPRSLSSSTLATVAPGSDLHRKVLSRRGQTVPPLDPPPLPLVKARCGTMVSRRAPREGGKTPVSPVAGQSVVYKKDRLLVVPRRSWNAATTTTHGRGTLRARPQADGIPSRRPHSGTK